MVSSIKEQSEASQAVTIPVQPDRHEFGSDLLSQFRPNLNAAAQQLRGEEQVALQQILKQAGMALVTFRARSACQNGRFDQVGSILSRSQSSEPNCQPDHLVPARIV